MIVTWLSLLLSMTGTPGSIPPAHYNISISGPSAEIEFFCDDPCKLDESKTVGVSGGKVSRSNTSVKDEKYTVTGSRIKRKSNMAAAIQCLGTCSGGKKRERLTFEAKRILREGFKVTISDRRAHFTFYSIVTTEKGPATRSQHADFLIDRPLIQLDLHGHSVEIRMQMVNSVSTVQPETGDS